MLRRGPRTGRVDSFDEARGVGRVVDDEGNVYGFHCSAITDGTRTIAVGSRVVFAVAPGHLGTLEARTVSRLEEQDLKQAETSGRRARS